MQTPDFVSGFQNCLEFSQPRTFHEVFFIYYTTLHYPMIIIIIVIIIIILIIIIISSQGFLPKGYSLVPGDLPSP